MEKVEEGTVFNVVGYDVRLLVLALNLMVTIPSCSVCKPMVEYRDSVRVEYRDSLIVKDSIIYVTLPSEQSANHLQISDKSKLETSLAESEAWVDSTGLHHTIRNKREPLGVLVPITTHLITDKAHSEKVPIITNPVKEEKPLSWWQKTRINAFWWLIVAVIFAYRKTILKLMKFLLHLQ